MAAEQEGGSPRARRSGEAAGTTATTAQGQGAAPPGPGDAARPDPGPHPGGKAPRKPRAGSSGTRTSPGRATRTEEPRSRAGAGTPERPTRSGGGPRTPTSPSPAALRSPGPRTPRPSPVEALLADRVEEAGEPGRVGAGTVGLADRLVAELRAGTARPGAAPAGEPGDAGGPGASGAIVPRPAGGSAEVGTTTEDVLLGLASLLAETVWRVATRSVEVVTRASSQVVAFVRAASPQFATAQADARLAALAARGRQARQERADALGDAVTGAIVSAATSDAMREMTVAAIEEAVDDVLTVLLPAMLRAITDVETQDKLDELMAGLLVRQLPGALEKTLPTVMMRAATRPVSLLSGVLARP